MIAFESIVVVITLTALVAYVNHRFLKLVPMIGVMLISLLLGLALIGLEAVGLPIETLTSTFVEKINFDELVMEGMLGFLLFAGALSVDIENLRRYKWQVITFSVADVVLSAFIVGGLAWGFSQLVGLGLEPIHALLFGALISQSDTVAVLGILRKVNAPQQLETAIAGESMFDDAVSVVLFMTLLDVLGGGQIDPGRMAMLFVAQAIGGIALGLLIGYIGSRLIESVQNFRVRALLTLAVAAGGYGLPEAIGASGVLSVVIASLVISARRRHWEDPDQTLLTNFWELLEELFNAALFMLVGLEVLLVDRTRGGLSAGLFWLSAVGAVPICLAGRFLSLILPVGLMSLRAKFPPHTRRIMTWGALRGGLPVAMALSLPMTTQSLSDVRDVILTMTYAVAVFSILVQGLSLKWLIAHSLPDRRPKAASSNPPAETS